MKVKCSLLSVSSSPCYHLALWDCNRYDDGLLEVMALYSSFHIAQLQVGLASPIRLGQASRVKVSVKAIISFVCRRISISWGPSWPVS